MPNHEEKFISKILFGFSALIASVLVILYACFERTQYDDWYFWGIIAAVLLCLGVYLMLSGFVHKVKSDLIRKQKVRQMQKSRKQIDTDEDEE